MHWQEKDWTTELGKVKPLYSRRFALLLLLFPIVIISAGASPSYRDGSEPPTVGLNKFDLLRQYLGTASGGDGSAAYRRVTQAMARKAISDAEDIGVRFLRISASGYTPAAYGKPGDLDLWIRDPEAHWRLFDQMMDDLHKRNVQAVLTLAWSSVQFPTMTGETIPEMLRDPTSRSFTLLSRYISELVTRYRSHPALMFYELTNELNSGADLDFVGRCRRYQPAPLCEPKGNYRTDDMIAFTSRLAEVIRRIDAKHPISSGFSVPRVFAQRLRGRPEWVTGKLETADTREQLEQYIRDTHQALDVISVHLYSAKGNRRFGSADEAELLAVLKQIADNIGKPLFIGEFGDTEKDISVPGSFTERMLKKIVELRIPYSAVWAWEFYQRNPYTRDDKNYSVDPGLSDGAIRMVIEANSALGNAIADKPGEDLNPPRVVLTWPLECTRLENDQLLHAVASDDSGYVRRVEFWLDGRILMMDESPPFEVRLRTTDLASGEHRITARAVDAAGNQSDWLTRVLVRPKKEDQKACRPSTVH